MQIIEEIEDRFGDKMSDLLGAVQNSLTMNATSKSARDGDNLNEPSTMIMDTAEVYREGWEDGDGEDASEVFDDMGAGAGIEGDLEVDDD